MHCTAPLIVFDNNTLKEHGTGGMGVGGVTKK